MKTKTLEKLIRLGFIVDNLGNWINNEIIAKIYKNGDIGLMKDKKQIKLIKG